MVKEDFVLAYMRFKFNISSTSKFNGFYMEVLDLRMNNPSIIQISEDFAFSVLQREASYHSSDLILETKKISHYPPESENLLSSSPNTHQYMPIKSGFTGPHGTDALTGIQR